MLNPPCGHFVCFWADFLKLCVTACHSVVAGQVHVICTVQDQEDSGANTEESYLAGCKCLTLKERKNKTNKLVILSIVRGSMVRRNLHHKISHNIENYLQWEKTLFFCCFFFLFHECWFHCVNCVSLYVFLTSVYAKKHETISWFSSFLFLSWGNCWKCTAALSVSSSLCVSPRRPKSKTAKTISTARRGWPRLLNFFLPFLVFVFFFVLPF